MGEGCVWLIIGFIGSKWAADKGYNGTVWFWAVFLGGVIPLYGVSLMEDQRLREAREGSRDETRIAEGNNLGWVYLRIGLVIALVILAGFLFLQFQHHRIVDRIFNETQAEQSY